MKPLTFVLFFSFLIIISFPFRVGDHICWCGESEIRVITEKIYIHPVGTFEDPFREDLHGSVECSCVRAVRSFGVDIPYGVNAVDFESNTEICVGVVVILRTTDYSHVAMVTAIEETGFWIKEGNYVKCKITERFIDFDDYRLKGFYQFNN